MLLSLKCILQAKSKRTILYSDEWTRKIPIWIFFGQQLALVHQRRDSTRQGTSSPYQNGYFDLVVWYWWFGDLNWIVLVLTIQCCPDSTWVWCIYKSSEKQDLLLHKDFAKGKFSKSWRGNLVETILAGKWYLFPSKSLDVSHFAMEIIWCPGQCNQTVETDALRLHWELIFWVWFDLGRLLREAVSISFSLLKVFMFFTINLFTLSSFGRRVWESTFCNIYICIGYMLPTTWGTYLSWIYVKKHTDRGQWT